MRFPRTSSIALLTTSALMGCSDMSPTESPQPKPAAAFALSESKATALENALKDLQERVLPALDVTEPLTGVLTEIQRALTSRDANALLRALGHTEATLEGMARGDHGMPEIDVEFDAIRLVLDEGRLLATGAASNQR